MSQARSERELDVVVWGATGFTGRLVAEYLLQTYGAGERLRWAMGGRNEAKLREVRSELCGAAGVAEDQVPLVLGDAADAESMTELARRTRVVCTTVGPYAKYGTPLVAACARTGTDYCDLTGEVQWMRKMIDAHHEEARASGARLVHTCGFDCIPSDIGVHFVQHQMRERHGVASPRIKYRVKGFSGGASGGTIASMMNMLDEAGQDSSVLRVMNDPYGLNPEGERAGADQGDRVAPAYDTDFGAWTGPFVMAAVDTRVVRRTNALLGYPYGKDFRYDEAMLMGSGPLGLTKAIGLTAGLGAGMAALQFGAVRRLAQRRLPSPGEGPSPEQREKGYFDVRLFAAHPDDPGKSLRARVTGDRDPGYGSTSKMLAESAVCLAQDELAAEGGCLTPAAAMGDALLQRLRASAGLTFDILE